MALVDKARVARLVTLAAGATIAAVGFAAPAADYVRVGAGLLGVGTPATLATSGAPAAPGAPAASGAAATSSASRAAGDGFAEPRLTFGLKAPDRPKPTPSPVPPPPKPGPDGYVLTTNTRAVSLTFDDGPSPEWTPQILAVLRDNRIKATFCLVGAMAQAFPQLVRAVVAAGHTLCNHSWNHNVRLGRLSAAAIRDDLHRTNVAIRAAAPRARIPYFRQPGGAWTQSVINAARDLGMTSLGWSADTRDWTRPPVVRLANLVRQSCHPGVIILLHDGGGVRRATLEALRRVLPTLRRTHTFAPMNPYGGARPVKP